MRLLDELILMKDGVTVKMKQTSNGKQCQRMSQALLTKVSRTALGRLAALGRRAFNAV
jgi:hypothetical protein